MFAHPNLTERQTTANAGASKLITALSYQPGVPIDDHLIRSLAPRTSHLKLDLTA